MSTFTFHLVLYYIIGIPGIIIGFTISFFLFSQRYILSMKYFNKDFSEISGKMKFALHSYSFNMSNALLICTSIKLLYLQYLDMQY